jgi:rare lipoprotein A
MIPARALPGLILIGIAVTLCACSSGATTQAESGKGLDVPPLPPVLSAIGPSAVGVASWYKFGPDLRRTCTGQPLLNDQLSAASPTLPMGTWARVALLHGDRSVVVRVNDCMPPGHRIIDVSEAAARDLGLLTCGVAFVRVTPVAPQ